MLCQALASFRTFTLLGVMVLTLISGMDPDTWGRTVGTCSKDLPGESDILAN
jgi:hypothetical protein